MEPIKPAPKPLTAADFFFEAYRSELGWYHSRCHELAHHVSGYLKEVGVPHRLLWIRSDERDSSKFYNYLRPVETWEILENTIWRFHVVVEAFGLVHDPWSCLPPLPRDEYMGRIFPDQPVKTIEGDFSWEQLRSQAVDEAYAAP